MIIGAQKCGTSFLYHFLSRHPRVEPATVKEVHYFDERFGEGLGWYRSHFPRPPADGSRSLTGEGSPYYIFHPHAPGRMARVIPGVKLIVLLRNPIERAYSHYHHQIRNRREPLSFEDAIAAEEGRLSGELEKIMEDESYLSFDHRHFSYLSRGVYVDQLRSWSRFFRDDQMLILKSEDFFEHTSNVFGRVQDFLDLPHWEPKALETASRRVKEPTYPPMDPSTRRLLRDHFEPHNRRLYEYLGRNLGW